MTIGEMLRAGTSYDQAVRYFYQGVIDQRTLDWFCLFHDWAAPRSSGAAGIKQDRFYNKVGPVAYWHRIERIKRLHDRFKLEHA